MPCLAKHSSLLHNHKLIIFGGKIQTDSKQILLNNDIYVLDLQSSAFYTLKNLISPSFKISPRSWHMCFIQDDHFYVIGGFVNQQQRRDIHCIALQDLFSSVEQVEPPGEENQEEIDEALWNERTLNLNHRKSVDSLHSFSSKLSLINNQRNFIELQSISQWEELQQFGELYSQRYTPPPPSHNRD